MRKFKNGETVYYRGGQYFAGTYMEHRNDEPKTPNLYHLKDTQIVAREDELSSTQTDWNNFIEGCE